MTDLTSLIEVGVLADSLGAPGWVLVDCRFDLSDTAAGRRAYRARHIPGAVYAHLDDDLSGPPTTDRGRHPLPPPERLKDVFESLGINTGTQVIVYDDSGGAIAARLWWMLRYMGHEAAAVLNGGWSAWVDAGLATESGERRNPLGTFSSAPREAWLVRYDDVPSAPLVVDSRDGSRYRGEIEPIDPVAGHIPGAINYPYARNLDSRGFFRSAAEVRGQLDEVLNDVRPEAAVFYCGSGVTACHNLLAQAYVGMPMSRLYVGSWSEWSRRMLDAND